MAKNIVIPKLGMSMTQAKILEWKAAEGERVEEEQVILVIETDKVTNEVEAPISGFLHILEGPETVLPVGGIAGVLAETQEELAELQKKSPPETESVEKDAASLVRKDTKTVPIAKERKKISPAARRMAEEHNIDISQVPGSGPGGRIIKDDIQKAMAEKDTIPEPTHKKDDITPPEEAIEGKTVKAVIPLKGMRQSIAEHMHRSLTIAAQLTNLAEVDISELISLRKGFVDKEESVGVKISLTDLFVYIVARALREFPIINASLIEGEIKLWEDINIGVAVAVEIGEYESGLIVPVIKNADKKSLVELNRAMQELAEKARDRKLSLDDVSGGTFTISNSGLFGPGGGWSTPIINQPQSGILQTGPFTEKPVVRDGEIVIRSIMSCCFTWDHRVMDGAPAAGFFGRIIELMENPGQLLL